MKQIKNGYADYYYLLEDGSVYNAAANMLLKISKKHSYLLKTIDNERKKVSVKTLYKLVYNKPFCIDNITNLDNEQWKQIYDTDGLYYISNKGRVKSLKGYTAIILKPFNNQSGYARVDLIESGKRQTRLVHRLVAAAFLKNPQNIHMQLHHKDFDKNNNAADNLEWLNPAAHYEIHKEYNRSLQNVKRESAKSKSNYNK